MSTFLFRLQLTRAAKLNNAFCSEPKVNKRAIDSLVMPEARKEMIRALVQKFTDPSGEKSAKSWGADFIENKGEGQIFLLHGSPGVGKTFVSSHIAIFGVVC
jgi:2-phosphoglycerate kinase